MAKKKKLKNDVTWGNNIVKKLPDGTEYVDENDDATMDAAIRGLTDDEEDPDEKEILEAWAIAEKKSLKKKSTNK